jgi:transposase InsO family protein
MLWGEPLCAIGSRTMASDFTYVATWKGPRHGHSDQWRDHGSIHHSDRGSQYLPIKYTERLADAGIEPSVGSVGDSYDNALAETINGLFKAEVIHRRGPWRSFEPVEYATLEWPYGDASIAYRLTGRLVQQPPPSRAHREHPTRRSRSKLLRCSGN